MEGNNSAKRSNAFDKLCKELAIDIPQKFVTTIHDRLCIYSVPLTLRRINEAAYTPQVISIGPIHYGELKDMELHKLRYFEAFCTRPANAGKGPSEILEELEGIIEEEEDEIRQCYSVISQLCSTQFVRMALLDAVFIFELFLRYLKRLNYVQDFIISKPWLSVAVQLDLILLENQLPYFILEKLYQSAVKNFTVHAQGRGHITQRKWREKTTFTDLIRYFWSLPDQKERSECEGIVQNRYNATKLTQAGVKFRTSAIPHLHSIGFCNGWRSELPGWIKNFVSLEMQFPRLEVDDTSECVIRNLMALEQCHYPKEAYICEYIKLLDSLIDKPKDVDFLVDQKIIANNLGDDAAVANFVNRLCLGVKQTEVSSNYKHISERLNSYYESKWNKNIAYFKSVYFSNVWIGTGTIVGVAVLLLTVANTVRLFATI